MPGARDHRMYLSAQLNAPGSAFWTGLAIVSSPNHLVALGHLGAQAFNGPRLIALRTAPVRRQHADSFLLNTRSTNWLRCSTVNIDFLPIYALLVDTLRITYPRVRRDRSTSNCMHLSARNAAAANALPELAAGELGH